MTLLVPLFVVGNILLQEHFDDPGALSRWTVRTGAALSGDHCPASQAKLDGGALRLSATKETCKWFSLEREVPLAEGGGWIEISARMRSEQIALDDSPIGNAYLSVTVSGDKRIAFRMFDGTQPWTHLSRRAEIPRGTKKVTVVCFLAAPGAMWFDDITVAVAEPPKFVELRRGPLLYRVLGSLPTEEQLRYTDETLRLTTQLLGVSAKGPITYFRYPNVEVKEQLTGRGGNAHVDERGALHTIWPTDRHELVHVLAEALGNPPALLAEGLAVHVTGEWQGKPLRVIAGQLLREGKWLDLDQILDSESFRKQDDNRSYPIAGFFVDWILEHAGREKLLTLYRKLSNDAPAANNRRTLEEVLGTPLSRLDQSIRESLTPAK